MTTTITLCVPDDPSGSFEPATVEPLPAALDATGLELMRSVSTLNASIHPIALAALEDASVSPIPTIRI